MMMRSTVLFFVTLTCLVACGGGGGSNPPAGGGNAGGGAGGGGTGGGAGGGGGGTTVTAGGLLSGAVGVGADGSIGGVQLDVAIGGTGLNAASALAGDVQAFGSVIANGIESNTDSAEFFIEGTSGSQADLRQGHQVVIVNDTGNTAVAVLYRSNVKGPVAGFTLVDPALGRSTFSALGQPVSTNASTTFANVKVADIVNGDLVEISGTLDEAGTLLASYVERKTALAEYKVVGVAANATATSFTLGTLDVDYGTATLQNFSGAAVANGNVLEVRGAPTDFTPPDQFAAAVVEQLPLLRIGSSASTEVEGFIDSFTGSDDFTVQTVPVTTNAGTIYVNGSAAGLAAGVKVEVEGPTDANGTIVAEEITVQPGGTMRAEGNVEALGANTITVLGVSFVIRDLTDLEDNSSAGTDPLTLANLAIGGTSRGRQSPFPPARHRHGGRLDRRYSGHRRGCHQHRWRHPVPGRKLGGHQRHRVLQCAGGGRLRPGNLGSVHRYRCIRRRAVARERLTQVAARVAALRGGRYLHVV